MSKEWLDKNGFNLNNTTFVYGLDNSYSIKNELKAAGFTYSRELLWHAKAIPAGYEKDCVEISADSVSDTLYGTRAFYPDVRTRVKNEINIAFPKKESEWIFNEKDYFKDLPVKLISKRNYNTRYGSSFLLKFSDDLGNILEYWNNGAAAMNCYEGEEYFLSGTVKKNDEYNGVKKTICTKCSLTKIFKEGENNVGFEL